MSELIRVPDLGGEGEVIARADDEVLERVARVE